MATCGAWTGLPPPLRLTRQAAPGLRCAHTRISLLKHAGTPHHWQALELEACVSALSHGTTLKQQKTTQPAPYRNALCCFSGSERRSVSPRAVHRPPPPAMASSWRSHAVTDSVAGFAEPAAYRVLENVDPETTDVGCRLVCHAEGLFRWDASTNNCSVSFCDLPVEEFVSAAVLRVLVERLADVSCSIGVPLVSTAAARGARHQWRRRPPI